MNDQQAQRFSHTRDDAGNILTVIDASTGLEWPVRPLPGRLTHQQAIDACAALDLAGHRDWALPTRQQLESLIDLKRYAPCIDTDAFPDFPARWFWTSDLCAWSSASAWVVSFDGGHVYNDRRRDSSGFALAVRRAGQ